MMMRILKKHPDIHSLNELHFFEKLWSSADKTRPIDEKEAVWMASRLLFIDRYNVLRKFEFEEFEATAKELVASIDKSPLFLHDIYHAVLLHRTRQEGKQIACEKTPQNLFYVGELLDMYPNCRIINMVRDPRGVLLSQKKKWMRKDSKDSYLKNNAQEVRRLKVNYHPITISKLWNSAISAIEKYEEHDRVLNVKFEDVTNSSEAELERICNFINVPYTDEMTRVEYNGSSTELNKTNQKVIGIKNTTVQSWMKGLEQAEIYFCQGITGGNFDKYGYEKVATRTNPFSVLYYYVSFPVKLVMALMMNLNRMKNIREAIRRRLFA